MNSDDTFLKNADIFQKIHDVSDNESEKSFSDLINDYNNSRIKNVEFSPVDAKRDQSSTSDDDSFEKIDMSDVLPPNKTPLNLIDEPLKPCKVDLVARTNKFRDAGQRDDDIVKQKYTKKKKKEIDKTFIDLNEAAEIERSLSQVSSLDLEEFDGSLVLPQEMVTKWAVQLLLALEKLHTLGVICR